jgi:hypothetical protein
VELGLNAATQAEALHLAATQDLRVLSIRAVRRPWQHKRSGFSLLLFSQELCTLLDAGLALIDALESLTEKASTEDAGRLLGQLVRLLYLLPGPGRLSRRIPAGVCGAGSVQRGNRLGQRRPGALCRLPPAAG